MLRLPPTSISLSENDLSFHLQQIDIYHGLLKQGFKKQDIARYFEEHQDAQRANAASVNLGPPSLSIVQLAARDARIVEPPAQAQPSPVKEHYADTAVTSYIPATAANQDFQDGGPVPSSPTLPASLQSQQHAPRQSSLLRFTQIPSSSSSDRTRTTTVPLPARAYRPHTDTLSYEQSEVSEAELIADVAKMEISPAQDDISTQRLRKSPSLNWAEAEHFVPGRLKHHSSLNALDDEANSLTTPRATFPIETAALPITPRLVSLDETLHQADDESSTIQERNMPSSPPDSDTQKSFNTARMPPSPTLPLMPTTPTTHRRGGRGARTEPRHRHQLDGASFSVYNDALPPMTQPQTPADLARHHLLTEFDAAYTAPPGVLHTGSPIRRARAGTIEQDLDESHSPMNHAMGARERRARELMRGARIEGVRLQRLRMQHRERVERGFDGNDEAREGPGPAVDEQMWRDELEGDRVGDENWDAEEGAMERGREGIRVVSGNTRARWWEV